MNRSQLFYIYLFCLNNIGSNHGYYKFNSLRCDLYDPELADIKQCLIKAIDRKHNMINIEALLNKSILELKIHFKVVKRERGGWHPFLYDMTVDVCKFFRNRKKFFVTNFLYTFLEPFTNINRTCPYLAGTEMRLWQWTPDEDGFLAKLPMDHGQYGLHSTWYINKSTVLQINGSILFFQ
ncbi:uncharacterized protein LOC110186145 [Drosophila serrata]|uniref:uncharacterized protein LOC110186145 n=1 Tax=Drosophila serrata TaxID=7274 RepID=UPI000A1D0186|nr:uncharacterized protein LOC110186145 [Drosophila serrata]